MIRKLQLFACHFIDPFDFLADNFYSISCTFFLGTEGMVSFILPLKLRLFAIVMFLCEFLSFENISLSSIAFCLKKISVSFIRCFCFGENFGFMFNRYIFTL